MRMNRQKFYHNVPADVIAHDKARDEWYAEANKANDEQLMQEQIQYARRRKREGFWLTVVICIVAVVLSVMAMGLVVFVAGVFQTKSSIFQKVDK